MLDGIYVHQPGEKEGKFMASHRARPFLRREFGPIRERRENAAMGLKSFRVSDRISWAGFRKEIGRPFSCRVYLCFPLEPSTGGTPLDKLEHDITCLFFHALVM